MCVSLWLVKVEYSFLLSSEAFPDNCVSVRSLGHSYEMTAIMEHFSRGGNKDPKTNIALQEPHLLYNWNLKAAIQDWAKKWNYQLPTVPAVVSSLLGIFNIAWQIWHSSLVGCIMANMLCTSPVQGQAATAAQYCVHPFPLQTQRK